MTDTAVRPGTGKVLKFFRIGAEPMSKLKDEIGELTDADLSQIVKGIEDGSLAY